MDKTSKSNGIFSLAIGKRSSGVRVRNTWATCREVGDSSPKGELIPHSVSETFSPDQSRGNLALFDGPAAYQLVGEVKAYQGDDG